ncbi:MAG: 7-carboxy-7-deazaguanine synthase [Lentisphaerae bacterium RIFOXYB12_FULL_65_16]|nr:MAG: 7-carboxy-7-deazaguanine synthase [Lentisphaerae bacterium RIFOXYA12_64_32]OGV85125.1 MAG: 7-carboxy-7-deazaguanine synthase [Lentisphaerae bacterium RIFOXYB12_FULL_65_16]
MRDLNSVTLDVCEMFRSIQGESTYAGLPCVFVRLTGCNLRCRYCDTGYAYEEGRKLSISSIIHRVDELGGGLVEVTGGEPLLQPATPTLLFALAESGRRVLLETNGTLLLPEVRPYHVIMDLKCPGSGQSEKTEWRNLELLQAGDEIKFVIWDRADFDWAVETILTRELDGAGLPLLFSPVAGKIEPERLAEWVLATGLPLRLQLQLHKLIWPGRERGV